MPNAQMLLSIYIVKKLNKILLLNLQSIILWVIFCLTLTIKTLGKVQDHCSGLIFGFKQLFSHWIYY